MRDLRLTTSGPLACVVLWLLHAETAHGAETATSTATLGNLAGPDSNSALAVKVEHSTHIDWVALPIPISNPTVGTGLAAAAMALYRVGGAKEPSNTALAVFATDNDSRGAGVLQQTFLGASRWQVNAALAAAQLNLDFYGVGEQAAQDVALPIEQKMKGGAVWALARVAKGLSIGARYRFDEVRIRPDLSQETIDGLPFAPAELDIDLTEATAELLVQYDTRDSRFSPSRGWYAEISAGFTDQALGSDITYQRHTADANWYLTLAPQLVLALRASLCAASDSAPFFAVCQFGQTSDLRGYVIGRYRDVAMAATQGELRWRFTKRFGAVAFAGVGDVAGSFGELEPGDPLWSAGAGLRFLASPENHVNIGVDVAYAEDETSLYFRIGEAF